MAFCVGIRGFDTYKGIDSNLAALRAKEEKHAYKKKLKLPVINYNDIAKKQGRIIIQLKHHTTEVCALCLDSMFRKNVKHLPCGHVIHSACFENQIKSRCPTWKNCASCRFNLRPFLSFDEVFNHYQETALARAWRNMPENGSNEDSDEEDENVVQDLLPDFNGAAIGDDGVLGNVDAAPNVVENDTGGGAVGGADVGEADVGGADVGGGAINVVQDFNVDNIEFTDFPEGVGTHINPYDNHMAAWQVGHNTNTNGGDNILDVVRDFPTNNLVNNIDANHDIIDNNILSNTIPGSVQDTRLQLLANTADLISSYQMVNPYDTIYNYNEDHNNYYENNIDSLITNVVNTATDYDNNTNGMAGGQYVIDALTNSDAPLDILFTLIDELNNNVLTNAEMEEID